MKKIFFLLLFTIASYGQAVFDEGIQITNTESTTATKVNVQEANGKVNTKTINTAFNKNFGLNTGDVVGATTLLNQYSTTPIDWTSTSFSSGQVVFYGGKQWIAKMATVAGDVPSVSSKWDEITFEALANKTTTVDQTIIDGSTNAVSGNAVFDGLATKAPISSVHNPVTIGTANGLSLATQQLSLGLASSGVTGALSGTDWNAFNNKQPAITGLTTNYLPKWNGSGFGNSQIFDNGINVGIGTASPTFSKLQIKGNDGNFIGYFYNNSGTAGQVKGVVIEAGTNTSDFALLVNSSQGSPYYKINGNGNSLFGTTLDNLVDKVQVNGTISALPATTANQVVVKSQLDAVARPYKVYTAIIQQSGTNAPVATVLENTLGGTLVWGRTSAGVYTGTLTGAFAFNKTVCFATSASANATNKKGIGITNANFVTLRATNSVDVESDGVVGGLSIEIRVYL